MTTTEVSPRASLKPKGFSDVDASGQAADHAAYLERAAERVRPRRQRWFEHLDLKPGEAVLDAGTGMGEVAKGFAEVVGSTGRAVGVDRSTELIERARAAAAGVDNLRYRVADLRSLPFEDGTFDAAYSERVFIHLDDPDAVMGELHRVLRPGGRLVIVDPDFSRATTDADDAELADLLTAQLDRFVANFRSGRKLRSQAVRAGFVDVQVEPEVRAVTDRDEFRLIAARPVEVRLDELVAEGVIDRARAEAFLADQDARAAEGRFLVSIVVYVVTARKAE